jgi:hypothetical protein
MCYFKTITQSSKKGKHHIETFRLVFEFVAHILPIFLENYNYKFTINKHISVNKHINKM